MAVLALGTRCAHLKTLLNFSDRLEHSTLRKKMAQSLRDALMVFQVLGDHSSGLTAGLWSMLPSQHSPTAHTQLALAVLSWNTMPRQC